MDISQINYRNCMLCRNYYLYLTLFVINILMHMYGSDLTLNSRVIFAGFKNALAKSKCIQLNGLSLFKQSIFPKKNDIVVKHDLW